MKTNAIALRKKWMTLLIVSFCCGMHAQNTNADTTSAQPSSPKSTEVKTTTSFNAEKKQTPTPSVDTDTCAQSDTKRKSVNAFENGILYKKNPVSSL